MTTIAIANQKGGVGKTTVTFNLGVGLARPKLAPPILIDLDPQAALTEAFALSYSNGTVYNLLTNDNMVVHDVATSVPEYNVVLCPASLDLAGAELELSNEIGREFKLRETLPKTAQTILIDCPPSLGLLTINALCAAEYVLIPVQTSYLAYRGMELILRTIEKVKQRANPQLRYWILPTMVENTVHSRDVLGQLESQYGEYLLESRIPKRVAFADAIGRHMSIFEYDVKSEAAESFRKLAEEIDAKTRADVQG